MLTWALMCFDWLGPGYYRGRGGDSDIHETGSATFQTIHARDGEPNRGFHHQAHMEMV